MSWLKKLFRSQVTTDPDKRKGVPEGIWTKCDDCSAILYRAEYERNLNVCPKCNHHGRVNARKRIEQLLDDTEQQELATEFKPEDILKFRDTKKYKDRLAAAQKNTGETDAIVVFRGRMHGLPVVLAVLDFQFIGGSMGRVVGQRFAAAAEICLEQRLPMICLSSSGGARMQEGLFSLMQMAKTSAAIAKMRQQGLPFISVVTHPTTGGVSASFAMLGDIIIAEPKALIGFTGPRVIEQTVREKLPEGFQRSEFLLEHGAIDMIVDRRLLRGKLASLLAKLQNKALPTSVDLNEEVPELDATDEPALSDDSPDDDSSSEN